MKQNLEFQHVKDLILAKFPLLGVHMASMKFVKSYSCPTMRTDGQNVYYSPHFFNSIPLETRCFVLTHEVMHIAFNHVMRLEDRDPFLWNIATDAVVNQILKAEGWKIPEGLVDIEEARDKSADDMYDILKKRFEKEQENSKQISTLQDEVRNDFNKEYGIETTTTEQMYKTPHYVNIENIVEDEATL